MQAISTLEDGVKSVFFCIYIYFIFSYMYVMLEAYGHLDAGCCVIYIAALSKQLGTARIQSVSL